MVLQINRAGPEFGISAVLSLISATISLLYVSVELIKLFTYLDKVSISPKKPKPEVKKDSKPKEGYESLTETLLPTDDDGEEKVTLPRHVTRFYKVGLFR